MKKVLVVALLILLSCTCVFAKGGAFGFRGSLTFSTIGETAGETSTDNDLLLGGRFSLVLNSPVNNFLSIQPEFGFQLNNGWAISGTVPVLGTKITTTYGFPSLEFPLLFKFGLPLGKAKLGFFVGPKASVFVGSVTTKIKTGENDPTSSSSSIEDSSLETFAFGFAGGFDLALKAGSGTLIFDFRYESDITDIDSRENIEKRRWSIAPSIAYLVKI